MMKANWLTLAMAETPASRDNNQNSPPKPGRLSPFRSSRLVSTKPSKAGLAKATLSSSVSGKIASPASSTKGRKA